MKIGFLFPGQGSQTLGMGKDLYEKYDKVKQVYDKVNQITGINIKEISFNGPEEELNKTGIRPVEQSKGNPIYQKYIAYKSEHPTSIVAYRLGDFYEVLGDNAVMLGNEMELTITSRDVGLKERVPMIGFPYHAAENYFAKIVRKHDLYIIENERETQFIPSLLHIDNRLIDKDTGEILSEEEMREFDGDIYEPQGIDEPETVTKQSIPNEIFALFGNKVEVR